MIFYMFGCLGLVHWDDPEGWYGEGGGRRVQEGEHMYTCGGLILIFVILVSLGYMPSSGIGGSYGSFIPSF